ncbi:hypothetical protein BC360_26580 [Ensifer sp. LC163]|nr:hypothetical protein BC360_26580 [Ensifer sp. LC163]
MDALSPRNRSATSLLVATAMFAATGAVADQKGKPEPLLIQEQGSFAVGGAAVNTPGTYDNNKPSAEGQSFHGDHLYAFYQVPQNPKALPIVMLAHDIRRMGDKAQATFAKGLRSAIEEVRKHLGEDADEGKAAAIYSQLVGGLILARATAASDPEFSEKLMEAAREAASQQIVGSSNSA